MYVSGIASATPLAADAHLVDERALLALLQRARRGAARGARRPRHRRCGACPRTRRRDCRARPPAGRPACRCARLHAAPRRSAPDVYSDAGCPRTRAPRAALGALGRSSPSAALRPLRPRRRHAGCEICATSVVGLVGDGDAGRQREVADAELVADVERRHVELDRDGMLAGHGLDGEREAGAARAGRRRAHPRPRPTRWRRHLGLRSSGRRGRARSRRASSVPFTGWRWI